MKSVKYRRESRSKMTTEIKSNKKKKRSPVLLTTILLLFLLIVILVTLAFFTSIDDVTNRFEGGKIDIILSEPKWKPEKAINIVPDATLEKDPYITNNEDVPAYVFLKVTVPAVKYNYDDNDGSDKGSKIEGTSQYIPLYKFAVTNDKGTPADASDDYLEWDKNFTASQKYYNDAEGNSSAWALVTPTIEFQNPKLIGENTNKAAYEYVFVYKGGNPIIGELAPHTTTTKPLFDAVHLLNFRNDNVYYTSGASSYSIKVQAYGIQSKYLGNNGEDVNDPLAVWNKINS